MTPRQSTATGPESRQLSPPLPGLDRTPPSMPGAGLYSLTAIIVAITLAVLFFVCYELLAQHQEHASAMAWRVYGALLAGLAALCIQAALVAGRFLRPLRESTAETARLRAALDNVSHHDPLTGVLNRVALEQTLVRALEGLKRYGAGFSGVLVQVEGFRSVDDAQGFGAGDEVLRELARLLQSHIRKADSLYRWRSGSFVILAPGIDAEQGERLSAKLNDLATSHSYPGGVLLSLTFGVSSARAEDTRELFVGRLKSALSQNRTGAVVARA